MPGYPVQPMPPQAPMLRQAPGAWQAPKTVRGVSADSVVRFMLPSPEALGVAVNAPTPVAVNAPVDWQAIQTRMEQLRVLRYQKDRLPAGGVRVVMLLPTSDPTRGQPVEAQAESESAAIVMALNAAEAWAKKR